MKWNAIQKEIETIQARLDTLRLLMVEAGLLEARWYGGRVGDVDLDVDLAWRIRGYDDDFVYYFSDEVIDMPETEYSAWVEGEKARQAEIQRKNAETKRLKAEQEARALEEQRYQTYLKLKKEFGGKGKQPTPHQEA